MDFNAGVPMSSLSPLMNQDAMWQMNLGSEETMETGSYPERPGEPDCSYYIRTGLCRFGSTCRFNHPRDRELVIATARMRGEYPERIGQPECEYYLKTGTCKFGVTCKFHHPRNKAGIAGRVSLNMLGYPLRSNEVDCAYFLRTGHCKFGGTCKFNHPQPQPTNMMVPTSGQQSYPWSRASFIASPRWQDPSTYPSLIMPQGVVPVQGWNPYSLGSVSPSGTGNDLNYNRSLQQSETKESGSPSQGSFSGFNPGSSVPLGGFYALPRENVFPERPGQPECQFYMKTGDCKFGTVCKFHHPRDRQAPPPDCLLSSIGLPLRPGEPLCVFYTRYGICKFGPSCKFDHPMRVFAYDNTASETDEVVETSSSGQSRRISVSETRQAAATTTSSGKDTTTIIDTQQ
ncbi:PREDICTED: zinc finger CCCH domain-containing protein 33 isoform X2 [Camelina sativa]|uniref:Zinc finger CCCH domain-containing protein 33 isoform X2 n=1 Tax=Camelina sativa TaxID=90675 RepID=A0ABM0YJE6_CAMSA|nr:PREDICTED: zinc finger CCCH domain-containing protein 33 isoform X2 [Camelina sativa]